MNRCLTDDEFARLTPAQKQKYLELLKAYTARRLQQMTPAQRQLFNAKMAGVKMAEYSPN